MTLNPDANPPECTFNPPNSTLIVNKLNTATKLWKGLPLQGLTDFDKLTVCR